MGTARRSSVLLAAIVLLLTSAGFAQGIHTTLRANANPYPKHNRYSDVWADGNYAYLGSDQANGVLIFDISNPDNPVLVGNYAPSTAPDTEDVKVSNGIGYFASNNGGGLHIVDVSDPANPTLIKQLTSADGGYDTIHNIALDGNYLYMTNYPFSPKIEVWDVSVPATPDLVTTITTTDSKYIHDMTVKNGRLYTSGFGGKTDIWDVSNVGTSGPVLLTSFNSGVRSHSSWPSDDDHYLFSSRELYGNGEVDVFDISNLSHVVQVATLTELGTGLDANAPSTPRVVGNLLYIAWDQAGLAVFDITDPVHPLLVGNYDTWPGPVKGVLFDGAWGVYPFLGQDRVLVSDRDTGLYVIDATQVSTQPAFLNLRLTPTTVYGTTPSTGQVFLVGKATSSGVTFGLSSDNPVATVPSNLVVPAGATNGTFTVNTSAVSVNTTATISASADTVRTAVLTIIPSVITSLTFSPSSLTGGLTSTGTVTFGAAVQQSTVVSLSVTSGGSAIAMLPPTVTVPAGSASANFTVTTAAVPSTTTAKISASSNGTSVTGTLTVQPNTPTSVTFNPTSVIGGSASSTGTVTFGVKLAQSTVVSLAVVSGGSAIGSLPSNITIPAGSMSGTFQVGTLPVSTSTTVKISATANSGSATGTLTVKPNVITRFLFTPGKLTGGASTVGTVTLSVPAVGNINVALAVVSGNSAVKSLPPSVTIPNGSASASFTVTTNAVTVSTGVTISATLNGSSKNAGFTVNPNSPSSFTFSPASIVGGASSTGTVSFSLPLASDATVTLAIVSGGSAVASIPSSVLATAGSSSVSFTLVSKAVTSQTTVTVSATANGGSKNGTLTVK